MRDLELQLRARPQKRKSSAEAHDDVLISTDNAAPAPDVHAAPVPVTPVLSDFHQPPVPIVKFV